MSPEKRTLMLISKGKTARFVESMTQKAVQNKTTLRNMCLIEKENVSDILFLAERWGLTPESVK